MQWGFDERCGHIALSNQWRTGNGSSGDRTRFGCTFVTQRRRHGRDHH